MDFFIRVDASVEIGTGHVMRCLTLAHRIKKEGGVVAFICRKAQGDCIPLIREQGFDVFELPTVQSPLWEYTTEQWKLDAEQTIDILRNHTVERLIIDHYSIDIKWEKLVRTFTKEIMVIDDLANRSHDCDVLLDQNFYLNMDSRYNDLVPTYTKLLLGPSFALLREEFIDAKSSIKPFSGKIERLFIFFGGSDFTNETEKVLKAISTLITEYELIVDVVVGSSNRNKARIQEICKGIKGGNYYCQISNMEQLMAQADLAIGAGGATTWERIFMKLPSIVIIVADNQKEVALDVEKLGVIKVIGESKYVSPNLIYETLHEFLTDENGLIDMQQRCIDIFLKNYLQ